MSVSQAQFTEAKQEESVSSKLGGHTLLGTIFGETKRNQLHLVVLSNLFMEI